MLLIVEDNETLQLFLRTVIARQHWRGIYASDGEQAIQLFLQHQREITSVFMDWNLAGRIDGLTAASRIRSKNPDIPIIALTAHASREHKKLCFEAGMTDFLSKPFTTDEFTRMVARWQPSTHQVSA